MTDQLAHDNTDGEARKDAGFSLLEILISITILGLLATIVVINVLPAQDQAMVQKARTDIATLEQALDAYLQAQEEADQG